MHYILIACIKLHILKSDIFIFDFEEEVFLEMRVTGYTIFKV
jgi:hypothetical protein